MASYEAKVLADYAATDPGELTVKTGETLTVLTASDGWCQCKKGGKVGYVPQDFLEKIVEAPKKPAADEMKKLANALSNAAVGDPKVKRCHACGEECSKEFVMAKDKPFHVDHFNCFKCKNSLAGKAFIEKDNGFYCENCYYDLFATKCAGCNQVIKGGYITALNKQWHPEHFVCTDCGKGFPDGQFKKNEDKPYCNDCYTKNFGVKCTRCSKYIDGQIFEALDKRYHVECFQCDATGHQIPADSLFHVYQDKVYCPEHFEQMFVVKCAYCEKNISGQFIKVWKNSYHPDCWKCKACGKSLADGDCDQVSGIFYCKSCHANVPKPPKKKAPTKPTEAELAAKAQAEAQAQAQPQAQASADKPAQSDADVPSADSIGPDSNRRVSSLLAKFQSKDEQKPKGPPPQIKLVEEKKEEEEEFPPDFKWVPQSCYSYDFLKAAKLPPGIDKSKKETYLSDEDFKKLFQMTRNDFNAMPEWKRQRAKKNLGLF